MKSECLDILHEVLHRFGAIIAEEHERLKEAILPELDSGRAGIRQGSSSKECSYKYVGKC